jgi:acyl carrier protein
LYGLRHKPCQAARRRSQARSIAAVNLTALEEHFGITVADDEIGASTLEMLDSLTQFIERELP